MPINGYAPQLSVASSLPQVRPSSKGNPNKGGNNKPSHNPTKEGSGS